MRAPKPEGSAAGVKIPVKSGRQEAAAKAVGVSSSGARSISIAEGRKLETAAVLNVDDAALVAEMSDLRLLAGDRALALTADQWTALAEISLETQAVRLRYEAQIAQSREVAPGHFRVEIPMYSQVGDALRARFQVQLRTRLGAFGADEVDLKLGTKLEGHFGGFGVSTQTLEINGDPRAADADCEVTRTITYWNSVEGTKKLSTRRETHYPKWEDPAGDRWGALLAVIGV